VSNRASTWAPLRPVVEGVGVFVALLGAVVFATWPLGRHLATHAPGNLGDPLLNAYLVGWGAHAALGNPLDLFGATMFDPERLTLAYTENLLGISLPFAPLFWITGNALLVLNLALLTAAAVAGLGAHLLVREITGRRLPALVCGVAYAVTPMRLAQIEHFHVFTVYAVPFVLLLLLRLDRDEGEGNRWAVRRRVAALAVVVAAGTWASLTGAVVIGLAVGSWSIWALLRRPLPTRTLARAALGVGVGLLLSAPVVVPYLVVRSDHPGYRHPEEVSRTFSATPGSYLSSPEGGVVVRDLYRELNERFENEEGAWEKRLFPGLALTLAASAGVVVAVRRRAVAGAPLLGLVLVATGFVFSLGPRWGGHDDGIPLPFMLFQAVVNLTRVPSRLGALVPVGLVVLGGWALAQLGPRLRVPMAVLSLLVVVVEAAPFVQEVRAPGITTAHRAVARRDGVVLALPTVEFDDRLAAPVGETIPREAQHLWLSTAHFRRTVNGYGAYHPPSFWEVVVAVQDFPSAPAMELFKRRDIRTVVVQTSLLPGTRWADVLSRMDAWPGMRRVTEADGVVVYDVASAAGTAPA
jgi:hypothetical protein